MALSGAAVAYATVGGLVLYSGVKGATLADTAKQVLAGNLNVTDTQPVDFSAPAGSSGGGSGGPGGAAGGNPGNVSSGSGGQNYLTIAEYLVANGYSRAAAAGIVGCVAGESAGSPEAVGDQGTSFGLVQEHGSQYSGLVTGNATRDLQAQLPAIIAYNNAQGSGLISMLNQIGDPVQAADFYSQHFERPLVTDSDVRAGVAQSVYAQLQANTQLNAAVP